MPEEGTPQEQEQESQGTREYNPELHCGAKNRSGKNGGVCTLKKGHGVPEPKRSENFARGNFRCKYHGGATTGSKTKEGRKKQAEAKLKSGFYSSVMTGEDKVNMQAAMKTSPPELLQESFHLIHARLRRLVEGEGNFSAQAKVLIQAMEVLLENQELTEEFVAEIKGRLLNWDIGRISSVIQQSANIIQACENLRLKGDMKVENKILKDFLLWCGRYSEDRAVKQRFVETLALMKLEAGLPQEEIAGYLQKVQEEHDDDEQSDELEAEVVDIEEEEYAGNSEEL